MSFPSSIHWFSKLFLNFNSSLLLLFFFLTTQVETCCWENYKQHKEKQEKLKYFKLPGYEEDPEERFLSEDSGLFEDVDEVQSWWSRYQPKVWKSLEEPYTSSWAKVVKWYFNLPVYSFTSNLKNVESLIKKLWIHITIDQTKHLQ